MENTSGNPHSNAVSRAPCTDSDTRVKWRIGVTFSNTPCVATSAKNTNRAASVEEMKIAGTWRVDSVAWRPDMTAGRITLGRKVVATMNKQPKGTSALNLAMNTSRNPTY